MSTASIDRVLDSLFERIPGLVGAEAARTMHAFPGGRVIDWTVRITVPRMGKHGQLLGRGVENLSGDGESVEEAADKAVQFYEYRRQGLV